MSNKPKQQQLPNMPIQIEDWHVLGISYVAWELINSYCNGGFTITDQATNRALFASVMEILITCDEDKAMIRLANRLLLDAAKAFSSYAEMLV